ncbi:hypothetical protein [Allofournierella sp.]|uniref:hypothetical protein n=1 Tax=Allofournierella sp. TaxID=1940256 RepID=UPI000D7A7A25|nr:MAG: hypothetical protein DBY43_02865 [Clostridiaceae bacterium]
MVPADRRRVRKDKTQQARRRRGDEWEQALAADLDAAGWAKCWPRGWAGQPWDISATVEGHSYAIECKRIARGNLGYSAFTSNEIENLSRHEDAGGISVVAILRDDPYAVRFVPWYAIRADVLGGGRGSVRLELYPDSLAGVLEVMHP